MQRKLRRKLDNAMIQKWRTDLNGMRHAHPVRLDEDVVSKVILLIELEKWTDPVTGQARGQPRKNSMSEGIRHRHSHQREPTDQGTDRSNGPARRLDLLNDGLDIPATDAD